MLANKRKLGLTLTSIMVAVGLSGILAVAGVRLVVNQMNSLRVMELIDKGDAIYKFYSNLLHDDMVWWCTLYDGAESTAANPNRALRNCVFGQGGCGLNMPMKLKGPDCKFNKPANRQRFKMRGELDFDPGNFQSSSVTFTTETVKHLKESVINDVADGWWSIELKWTEMSNNAVDLVLTQDFIADRWQVTSAGKRYLPQLNYPRELRVRRSSNYIVNTCSDEAVTRIALHTHGRTTNCGEKIVDITSAHCPTADSLWGGVVQSTSGGDVACSSQVASGGRVSVTPTDCGVDHSVIWKIGENVSGAASNVECALERRGKMVNYRICSPSSFTEISACTGNISVDNIGVVGISAAGSVVCDTLRGYPGPQGSSGGSGGKGPPGTQMWWPVCRNP